MLASQSNWIFTYKDDENARYSDIENLPYSTIVKQLLWQRGLKSEKEIHDFLQPNLENLHDPSLFSTIESAVNRVEKAIELGESILVYGDYDADGVTSTTVMVEALREKGAMCDYYIPNRFTEGYGPNKAAFQEIHRQGFQLIITVDNGIAGTEEIAYANELGMDVIITDHHEVQEELPDALAIIHPKCAEDYPFKELAGVGVAFKFATQLLGYFPKKFLDLVAIGTIADLVPLVGENRVLVSYGLKEMATTERIGLQALKKQCSIDGQVTEEDIGFRIGPRLNAVGRLQDANIAVDLLLATDQEEAEELVQYVQELNKERQKIVANIAEEAIELLEQSGNTEEMDVLVVAKEGWNQGVLGIVASRLVQTYHRPAIVLAIDPELETAKGSARSIEGFDLFKNGMEHKDLFTHFGGHAQAAGMTLPRKNIEPLRKALDQQAKTILTEEDFKPQLKIDATIPLKDIDIAVIKELEQLAPFGMNNPKPNLHIEATPIELRQIGATKNHLKVKLEQAGTVMDGIGFGLGAFFHQLSKESKLEAVVELQINEWNGIRKPQVFLKDLAVSEWQLFDYRGQQSWLKHIDPTCSDQYFVYFKENLYQDVIDAVEARQVIEEKKTVNALYLLDLPNTLEELTFLLQKVESSRIYACFQARESSYFTTLPTREEFKWLYQLILQRQFFDYKVDAPKLASYKGWKLEKIKFMFQVFHELNFVTREGGRIIPKQSPEKKDLTASSLYQSLQEQRKVEETLYLSSYPQLKAWIDQQLNTGAVPEEEMVYGL
ncbi:single-stranded-DNA-specific exonuclease RecJ [Gracilibacillus dipsosauri]|uniref:Single-stranded-DNA-specific exonuclease RecJ n=1 Tax=Gracilibacillus dipsosauri TaxID=178340 RepID=A0A317KZ60_9BACI|nr:single-stranded-DNA-specific exonuclease RecJ [Gracilibacillus dipsosauri]PWU68374.1 single-stranded-DNA-specific exonuclease RecJ [Gracilibacillus dipsosauri]